MCNLADSLLKLYKGKFLHGCDDYYWLLQKRDQFQKNFMKSIDIVVTFLEQSGQTNTANQYYTKARNLCYDNL